MDQRLRGIDILGLIFAALCLLEAGLGLLMQPWMRILEDFGPILPRVTKMMLSPTTTIALGLTPMALVLEGAMRRRSEASQVVRCVLAILATISLLVGLVGLLNLVSRMGPGMVS